MAGSINGLSQKQKDRKAAKANELKTALANELARRQYVRSATGYVSFVNSFVTQSYSAPVASGNVKYPPAANKMPSVSEANKLINALNFVIDGAVPVAENITGSQGGKPVRGQSTIPSQFYEDMASKVAILASKSISGVPGPNHLSNTTPQMYKPGDAATNQPEEDHGCSQQCTGFCSGSCINQCNGCTGCVATCGTGCADGCNDTCNAGSYIASGDCSSGTCTGGAHR